MRLSKQPGFGFTLFELLLVLSLLAILTRAALPLAIRAMSGAEVQHAADHLRKTVTDARMRTVRDGRVRKVVIHPGGGHYQTDVLLQDGERSARHELPLNCKFQAASAQRLVIEFYPNGLATSAEFSIQNQTRQAIDLSVDRLTGAVQVSRVYQP